MREYSYEIWTTANGEHRPVRVAVATDPDPLKAFQEALKAVKDLKEYEIVEVTRKKVHSNESS